MGKALYEQGIESDGLVQVCSMYDKQEDAFGNPYFPAENFRGFGIKKIKFIKEMVQAGFTYQRVVLSHINLLPIGWLIKKIAPRTQLILLAHGIEIWYPLSKRKRRMLQHCDEILAVSSYTRNTIIHTHGIDQQKVQVLNNSLDPFLPLPSVFTKNEALMQKYGFKKTDIILMALTRLASRERYKGYDKVIGAMAALKPKYPNIKYLIAGRYDSREKVFIDQLLKEKGLQNAVIIPGFIPD
ncbi:MAG: glycosyltransferase family 4 protein, partial [Ferruginibacter sp.]